MGGGNEWTVGGEASGLTVDVEELLLLPELLESSLGVFVGPGRLVLSTLVMVVPCMGLVRPSNTMARHSTAVSASLRVGS